MGIPYVEQYPYLFNLIGAWFHQDYSIEGNTLEEIMSSFRESSPAEDLLGTRADIHRFLRHFDGANLQNEFIRMFEPGVLPIAWDMDTKQFLLRIDELLQ